MNRLELIAGLKGKGFIQISNKRISQLKRLKESFDDIEFNSRCPNCKDSSSTSKNHLRAHINYFCRKCNYEESWSLKGDEGVKRFYHSYGRARNYW